MQGEILVLLVAQGLCFTLWAYLSFRALFQIRAIAAGRSGRPFPGPISFVSATGVWLRDPAQRVARVLWVLSLVGIMAPSVLIAYGSSAAE